MKDINIVTFVWNRDYIDEFLDVVLLTYMSPNNLASNKIEHELNFTIYTDDADYISNNSNYKRLCNMVNANVINNITKTDDKFHSANNTISRIIKRNKLKYDGLVVIYPDMLVSDGSFKNLYSKIDDYKMIYNVTNLRVVKETIVPYMKEYLKHNDGISSRDLVRAMMNNTHDITESYNARHFRNKNPCVLIWKANETNWILRSIHQYPMYIDMDYLKQVPTLHKGAFLDTRLLMLDTIDKNDTYVFTDSDDFFETNIAPLDTNDFKPEFMFNTDVSREYLYQNLSSHQNYIYNNLRPLDYTFRVHSDDNDDGVLDARLESNVLINEFYQRLNI